jgi:hypothetical protein
MTRREAVAGLRAWAKGVYGTEAAVELLVRAFRGRFVDPGHPWIVHDPGEDWYWLDPGPMTGPATVGLSEAERRVLAIVASLAGGDPVDLPDAVTGLDRTTLRLVLAAVAHAAGSHQDPHLVYDYDEAVAVQRGRLPSVCPWPDELASLVS